MNSAIIAVTKSAYATFHAPPWCPPWVTFFLIMIGGGPGIARPVSRRGCSGCVAAFILDVFFCFLKRWPHIAGNRPPPELHRDHRWRALDKAHDHHAHYLIKRVLLFRRLQHVSVNRPDESVAKQNTQESSHQRCRHLLADLFRRTSQRAHGDHHAPHRLHNPHPRPPVRHRLSLPHTLS